MWVFDLFCRLLHLWLFRRFLTRGRDKLLEPLFESGRVFIASDLASSFNERSALWRHLRLSHRHLASAVDIFQVSIW